ncbi:MAG TPA: COX15/CtaA family protein [Mycobacteriales bacterium]|nr:COX15/CtaA family protein [Mycobacteriales bacterium]
MGPQLRRLRLWPAGPATTRRAQRALRPVAGATLVATYALLGLGSTVRVTASGMGCTGWPLCDGRIGPIERFHPLLEQAHRYLAAAVTLAVVMVAVLAWRARAGRRTLGPALAAVLLVGVQVVLGAVTVMTGNAPATVALHLVGALLLLAAVTVTAVVTAAPPDPGRPTTATRAWPGALAGSALTATFVLLVSGSLVLDDGASAACPSWPWCPPHAGVAVALRIVALLHRAMAGVAVLLLVALAVRTIARRRETAPGAVALAGMLVALLPAQVAVGAASALFGSPPAIQDLHLGLAAAIWVCVVALVAVSRPVGRRPPNPDSDHAVAVVTATR